MMKLKYGYIIALVVLVATLALFAACDNTQPVEQPTQYQLTFYAQGQVHSTLQISGNQRINMPASPEKAGYIFNGWYLDEGTWNTLLTADAFADKAVDADLTVYAKYTPIKYALTYELGGAEQSNPAEYTIEQQLVLQDAVKQHYDFVGWYTDAELTTPISEIPVGTTGNMTLYPKFAPTAYKATFMDGETVVGEVTYTVETNKIQAPEVPEHAGFVGAWEEYELIPGGITVNAKYEAVNYTITYEGVKASEHKNPAGYDVTLEPITLVDAEREHYLFAGWYTDAECTNRVTEIAAGTTGDLVLYAKWTPVAYKAVFMDGETVVGEVTYTVETESIEAPAVPEHVGYTGEWEKFELTPGGVTVNAVYTEIVYTLTYEGVLPEEHENPAEYDATQWPLVLGEAVREHYVFAGWYTEPAFENLVTEIAEGTTGDLVLYAKWTPVEYTAVFTDGETEQEVIYTVETESIELPEVPARPGYAGEWEAFELTPGGVTVNAVYTLITYTVTYENTKDVVHANPEAYTVETETVTLADLSKPGYIFNGWYVGENRVTEIAPGSTGDVVLTASWTAIVYEIKLHFDPAWGEYAEATNPLTYTVEDTVVFAELTCKVPGYVFDGWYTEKNRGEGTKITELSGVIGDVELYAQFVPIRYTITYVGAEDAMYVNPDEYTIESDAIHLYPAMMDGYVFGGWFADEQLSVPASLVIPTGSTGDITLYTKWTPITYVIEYEGNGGVLPENPAIYNTTQTITLKNPTRAGYVFLGWFDAPEDGEQVMQIVPGTTGNLKLYAYWEPIYYSITYHLYGGENVLVDMQALLQAYLQGNLNGALLTGNLPIYTTDFPIVPLFAASKPGYTFEGWYADPAYTKRVYMINPATLANVELYAKWSLATYSVTYDLPEGATHDNPATYTVLDQLDALNPATLEGYTFLGWYKDAERTIEVTHLLGTGKYEDVTLYAKFVPKQYFVWLGSDEDNSHDVTFDSNFDEQETFVQTVTLEQGLTLPELPVRAGYLFAGWYDNAACEGEVFDLSAPVMGDITLYAKWIAYEKAVSINAPIAVTLNGVTEYKFTFVSLVDTVITVKTEGLLDTFGALYDAEGNLLLANDDVATDHKNFELIYQVVAGCEYTIAVRGFSEAVQGTTTLSVSGFATVPAGGKAYLENLYTVSTGAMFKLPVPEAREGYQFLGWADENDVMYTNAMGISLQAWSTDADVVLHEVWVELV